MSEKTEIIPNEVLDIIEAEEERRIDEILQKKQAEEAERLANIEKGRPILAEWVERRRCGLPDWAQAYFSASDDDDTLEKAGAYGHQGGIEAVCKLEIPGLAPIAVKLVCGGTSKECFQYVIPGAHYDNSDWDLAEPCYWWGGNYPTGTLSLEEALVVAKHKAELLEKKREQYRQDCEARNCEKERSAEAAQVQSVEKAVEQEKDEAEFLMSMLRDDPVAIHLLKAFLAIRQERSMYEERISEADEALYSTEERWSRRAADLRRQAQEADRHAEEERIRASDLEDDLAKAEKKEKRGW